MFFRSKSRRDDEMAVSQKIEKSARPILSGAALYKKTDPEILTGFCGFEHNTPQQKRGKHKRLILQEFSVSNRARNRRTWHRRLLQLGG